MKFLSDENITRKATNLFKDEGYDIETVQSLNLRSIKNSQLLNQAVRLKRILITFDSDFKSVTIESFPGIILIEVIPNIDSKILPALKKFVKNLREIAVS